MGGGRWLASITAFEHQVSKIPMDISIDKCNNTWAWNLNFFFEEVPNILKLCSKGKIDLIVFIQLWSLRSSYWLVTFLHLPFYVDPGVAIINLCGCFI